MSAPGRPSSLHSTVPPTLGIDPGRHTAVLARIDTQVLATAVVTSEAAPRAGQTIHACPPDPAALAQVIAALAVMAAEHDGAARSWWAARGHVIPANQSPWLLAVEKVILPVEDAERGYTVTPDILAPLIATAAIAYGVGAAWGLERVVWVRPHLADTRWQIRHSGTGRMQDYWPETLLGDPATHLRAAWHHASDAAEDYERHCRRHGRLLPPHLGLPAPALVPALLGAAAAPTLTATHRTAVRPVGGSTAPPVRIPAPRAPEPDPAEILAEIRRLVAEAVAASRPVLAVVREHLAAEQPDPLAAPAAWSHYSARRTALLAATRVA